MSKHYENPSIGEVELTEGEIDRLYSSEILGEDVLALALKIS